MRKTQHKLRVARGEEPAELLFKNAQLVNVLSGEIHDANVAVDDGRVIGFGDYEAHKTIDLNGAYLAPSLIDGHFHVESTMVTIPEFVRAVVPHGTGAMVIDPHEYANVLGMDGIRYVSSPPKIYRSISSSCCRHVCRQLIWKRRARILRPTIYRS